MESKKEFLGTGWAYPVALDNSGKLAMAAYEADVYQALHIILGTAPGERVMRPDFGCGIYQMVFEVIDSASLTRIRELVAQALIRHEPRIEVLEIKVDAYAAADGRLEIAIDYRIRKTNQNGNLVYPFYFREGGRA